MLKKNKKTLIRLATVLISVQLVFTSIAVTDKVFATGGSGDSSKPLSANSSKPLSANSSKPLSAKAGVDVSRDVDTGGFAGCVKPSDIVLEDVTNKESGTALRARRMESLAYKVIYSSASDYKEMADGRTLNYYKLLPSSEKKLYRAIVSLARRPKKDVMVEFATTSKKSVPVNEDILAHVVNSVIYDYPELFWFWMGDYPYKYKSSYSKGRYTWYIGIDYKKAKRIADKANSSNKPFIYSRSEINKMTGELERAADHLLAGIDKNQPPAVIALKVHDKLAKSIRYDNSAAKGSSNFFDVAHTAYGCIVNQKAVCDGISLAYTYLLQKCGVNSFAVAGLAGEGDRDFVPGLNSGHAWNVVELNGQWYETDLTWNLPSRKGGKVFHDFYNLKTDRMAMSYNDSSGLFFVHLRSDYLQKIDVDKYISIGWTDGRMLPEAKGKHFTYRYMKSCGKRLPVNYSSSGIPLCISTKDKKYTSYNLPFKSGWDMILSYKKGRKIIPMDNLVWKAKTVVPAGSSVHLVRDWNPKDRVIKFKAGSDFDKGRNNKVMVDLVFDNGALGRIERSFMTDGRLELSKTLYNYDGKNYLPKFRIYSSGRTPLPSSCYSIEDMGGRADVGKYMVRADFKGSSINVKPQEKYFTIRPAKTSIKKIKKFKRGRARVYYKKSIPDVDGYEIQISSSKNFPLSKRKEYTMGSRTYKKGVTKLKSGRTYYVRVRSWKTAGVYDSTGREFKKKKINSSWSVSKKFKAV